MEFYIALETWFSMLLRLEEKWHKWFFCSEDVMDPTVYLSFNAGPGGMGKKGEVSIQFPSPKKNK